MYQGCVSSKAAACVTVTDCGWELEFPLNRTIASDLAGLGRRAKGVPL